MSAQATHLGLEHIPCITRAWSDANLMPSSVIWTWTLGAKLMHLRSWYMGRVDVATARKIGGASGAMTTFVQDLPELATQV